jgi:purine-binding chemotaxis protein CheW
MAEQAAAEITEELQQKAGKYLTFVLAEEEYGLEILKVREIIGMMDITAVPRTPDFVKGVINLRGKVIPVVDLRLKFGMSEVERTEETCVIVVNVGDVEMGIIVDKVSEVLDIVAEDIEDSPAFGADVDTNFILGMGKSNDRVTILLDIDKVLSGMDAVAAATAAQVSQETVETN